MKYMDVHLYGVAAGVRTWRATMRLEGSEIYDLVMALTPNMSGTRLVDLGEATFQLFDQHPERINKPID